jgi:uncharacterized protein YndB with AHSA1/START domain
MTEWVHRFSVTLPADPARVFTALTSPSELERWFAEHVEIDARSGGVFRSWGRYTYGAPEAAGGTITVFEPDRRLAFEWSFDGVPSHVDWLLSRDSADTARTSLALTHAFDRSSAVAHERELVEDLWRLILGNLDAHLRGGNGIVRPDFTSPDAEIRLSIVIDAPREKVFRALTDPDALARWFSLPSSKPPVVEKRIGGVYDLGWEYEMGGKLVRAGTTKILDLVENERLVTDWLDWRGDPSRHPQRIAWLLEDAGGKTRVTFVHDGFERPADIGDYPFGWRGFLEQLKDSVEGTN